MTLAPVGSRALPEAVRLSRRPPGRYPARRPGRAGDTDSATERVFLQLAVGGRARSGHAVFARHPPPFRRPGRSPRCRYEDLVRRLGTMRRSAKALRFRQPACCPPTGAVPPGALIGVGPGDVGAMPEQLAVALDTAQLPTLIICLRIPQRSPPRRGISDLERHCWLRDWASLGTGGPAVANSAPSRACSTPGAQARPAQGPEEDRLGAASSWTIPAKSTGAARARSTDPARPAEPTQRAPLRG